MGKGWKPWLLASILAGATRQSRPSLQHGAQVTVAVRLGAFTRRAQSHLGAFVLVGRRKS